MLYSKTAGMVFICKVKQINHNVQVLFALPLAYGHYWVVFLAGTTVGGLYVAFPLAAVLYHKGARLTVIFTNVGAAPS